MYDLLVVVVIQEVEHHPPFVVMNGETLKKYLCTETYVGDKIRYLPECQKDQHERPYMTCKFEHFDNIKFE